MKKLKYDIIVRDMIPPIGGMVRFYAKVSNLYQDMGSHERIIAHDFGETHGKTKDEAEKQMREIVDDWISKQP